MYNSIDSINPFWWCNNYHMNGSIGQWLCPKDKKIVLLHGPLKLVWWNFNNLKLNGWEYIGHFEKFVNDFCQHKPVPASQVVGMKAW